MSSPNDAPPPYPGSSSFSLLSYDETIAVDDAADSLRLPSYQPRTSRRFHPYSRVNLRARSFLYENTVYDDSYIPLDVSLPAVTPTLSLAANVAAASTIPAVSPANPPPLSALDAEIGPEEQHRRRVLRLFHLIPEFERAVRQASTVAQQQKCFTKDPTVTDKPTTN